jgi:hypothetical protein
MRAVLSPSRVPACLGRSTDLVTRQVHDLGAGGGAVSYFGGTEKGLWPSGLLREPGDGI